MKLFSCKVRLSGSVNNEVRKSGVTKAEVEVLRALHGSDAVVEIKPNGDVERSENDERDRLESVYLGPGTTETTMTKVQAVLGPRRFSFDDEPELPMDPPPVQPDPPQRRPRA